MKNVLFLLICLGVSQWAMAQTYQLDKTACQLNWTGQAAFSAYSLSGTIKVKTGQLTVEDQQLINATVTVNTKSIYSDIKRLKNHLHSEDFFYVKQYPTASFELLEFIPLVGGEQLAKGNLTIRGVTKPFSTTVQLKRANGKIVISGSATINRTDFGVNYNSPSIFASLKDDAIADEFTLDFVLAFFE